MSKKTTLFFAGNEHIHILTAQRNNTVRFDLEAFSGEKAFAEYAVFNVGSESSNYTLTIEGYSGTAGMKLSYRVFGQLFKTNQCVPKT